MQYYRLALGDLERKRAEIEKEISNLRRELGGAPSRGSRLRAVGPVRRRRRMSREGRKRISEAMKRRWAERKKASRG
ncbi:MAG: hypothetical protein HY652_01215 [Acidobacteria bacterium]|nr:hypothetical protein [Acidobacteriota bacterium]